MLPLNKVYPEDKDLNLTRVWIFIFSFLGYLPLAYSSFFSHLQNPGIKQACAYFIQIGIGYCVQHQLGNISLWTEDVLILVLNNIKSHRQIELCADPGHCRLWCLQKRYVAKLNSLCCQFHCFLRSRYQIAERFLDGVFCPFNQVKLEVSPGELELYTARKSRKGTDGLDVVELECSVFHQA